MPETAATTAKPRVPVLPVHGIGQAALVQAAPGQFVPVEISKDMVPRYGFVRMTPQPDGTYRAVLVHSAGFVRLGHDLPERLGITGMSFRTLLRLISGGFVACSRPAPRTYLVDLQSLANHLQASTDPEFWTDERKRRFTLASAEDIGRELRDRSKTSAD
jgi:hypothetical protein